MIQNKTETKIVNKALSIQISLNGLSFCILDTLTNTVIQLKTFPASKKQTPQELLDHLLFSLNTESILQEDFDTVTIIHVNELSTLVPKPLFNKNCIADYLKFNNKILETDFIAHDTIVLNDSVNVYVPYININNAIYDRFGDFTYKHYSTILIESVLIAEKNTRGSKLYLHVDTSHFEIIVVNDSALISYNTFEYDTPEDFIYYILFTAEQLALNPETINVILLGAINDTDALYEIVFKYIRHVSFGNRADSFSFIEKPNTNHSHFTLLKSL